MAGEQDSGAQVDSRAAAEPAQHALPTDPPWRRPERLGHQEAMKALGGVVAPLLAGFSLSTIAILVTSDHHPTLWQPAVLGFAAAASLLLYSMQVAFLALQHYASPTDWLTWYPEATVNTESLTDVRQRQAKDQERVKAFSRRYAVTYELGLLCFIGGLWLLVWPAWPAKGQFPYWRVGALVIVGAAFLIEVWWMTARLYNGHQERKKSGRRMPRPTAWRDVPDPDVQPPSRTALAGLLDPERREASKRWFPDLSGLPPDR